MLGKFLSDPIEKEFGKLRQGSGGTYFITSKCVFDKIRIQKSKIFLQFNDRNDLTEIDSKHICEKCTFSPTDELLENLSQITLIGDIENLLSTDSIMALVYIAGYVIRHDDLSSDESFLFYERYGDYMKQLNRGGLTIPGDCVCQWVMMSYILFQKISDSVCRTSLSSVLLGLSDLNCFKMTKSNAYVLSNIFLNNHCHLYSPSSNKESRQKIIKLS